MWIRDRDPFRGLGSEYVTSLVFLISHLCSHQSLSSASLPHPRKQQELWGSLSLKSSALFPKARWEGCTAVAAATSVPPGNLQSGGVCPSLGWCPGCRGRHRCRAALTLGSHHCSVRSRAWFSILKHFHCVRALGPGCPVTATRCPGTDLLP